MSRTTYPSVYELTAEIFTWLPDNQFGNHFLRDVFRFINITPDQNRSTETEYTEFEIWKG